jgi:hypothetical protein
VTDAANAVGPGDELQGLERRPVHGRATTRRRRPPAVTILAAIQLLEALAYGLLFLAVLLDASAARDALAALGGTVTGGLAAAELAALRAITGGLFVAAAAGGILLLRMRQLGWTLTMLLTGIGLASSIYSWVTQGNVFSIWLLAQVVTVFYLNQRQVRHSFGITGRSPGLDPEESRG